jgi:hypothetical protein
MDEPPYWHTERARIKKTRRVPVELIVNGVPVDTMQVVADGKWTMLNFKYAIKLGGAQDLPQRAQQSCFCCGGQKTHSYPGECRMAPKGG